MVRKWSTVPIPLSYTTLTSLNPLGYVSELPQALLSPMLALTRNSFASLCAQVPKDEALAARTPAAVFVSAPKNTSDADGAQPLLLSAAQVLEVRQETTQQPPI
jgi:hypothetical protein